MHGCCFFMASHSESSRKRPAVLSAEKSASTEVSGVSPLSRTSEILFASAYSSGSVTESLRRAPEDRADPSGGPGYGQGLPEDQGLSYDHAEGLMP